MYRASFVNQTLQVSELLTSLGWLKSHMLNTCETIPVKIKT